MALKDTLKRLVYGKAVTDLSNYNEGSITLYEGAGQRGVKYHPFNQQAGIDAFRSWAFAAARINANAVASVPLRLYVRGERGKAGFKVDGRECLFKTRPVSRGVKRRLMGEGQHGPHNDTRRKLIEFGDFEEVTERHPVLDLLANVNPLLNGFDFTYMRMIWIQMTGNAYTMVYHGDGEGQAPTELWPMPPQYTWVVPSRENWIDGYVYGHQEADKHEFAPDEIIHFRMNPGVRDLIYGMGWAEAVWHSLALDGSNDIMDRALSENHARPDYAVIMEGGTADQANNLEEAINRRHKGSRKAGRSAVLAGPKITMQPLSFPPKDMTGRDELAEKIASASGVPVSMLKANDPNLASAKQGYQQWRESTVLPMCRSDEQQLNQDFVPLFDDRLVLAYDNPVPGDEERDARVTQVYVGSGIMTANEGRQGLNLEPSDTEHADELLINGQPLGGIEQPAPFAFNLNQPEPGPSVTVNSEQPDMTAVAGLVESVGKLVAALETKAESGEEIKAASLADITLEDVAENMGIEGVKQSDVMQGKGAGCTCSKAKDDGDGDAGDTMREDERKRPMLEFSQTMAGIFVDQVEAVARMVEGMKADPNIQTKDAAEDRAAAIREMESLLAQFDDQMDDAIRPFMESSLDTGGAAGLSRLESPDLSPFDVTNPKVAEYLEQNTMKLRAQLQQTTARALTDVVADGLQQGQTPANISTALREQAPELSKTRSDAIARTESARAYVDGQELAWEQSGVVEGKQWLLAPDACEFCKRAAKDFNDKTVKLGEAFYPKGATIVGVEGGVMKADYSAINGPPLHPNDRCDTVPILIED